MNQSCSKTWGKCNFSSLDSFEEKFAISFKNNEKYSYSPKRKTRITWIFEVGDTNYVKSKL